MARNMHSVRKVGMVVHGTWRWNHQWETEEIFREATESTETNKYQDKKSPQENSILKIYLNLILAICITSKETTDIIYCVFVLVLA